MTPASPPCEWVDDIPTGPTPVGLLTNDVLTAAIPILRQGVANGAPVHAELAAIQAELARRTRRGHRR